MAEVICEDEGETPRKALKRKRHLRRLDDGNTRKRCCNSLEIYKIHKIQNSQRCSKKLLITCSLFAFCFAIFVGNYIGSRDIRNLVTIISKSYWRNFQQVVHGKYYCDELLDADELSDDIRRENSILHQSKALLELQSALKYERNLISIALVGPVGVGKTLYTNVLQKYFPWPQNVHSLIWNIFVHKETEKYRRLYMILENFSDCGVNLLIIKNLRPTDRDIVGKLVDMIQHDHNLRQKRIILIFIFHLNTMLEDHVEYSAQQESLQNLKYTTSINFKPFGKEELKDCIERELALENLTISQSVFEELLNTIDVKRSGCKNVNSKVLAFGFQAKLSKSIEDSEV